MAVTDLSAAAVRPDAAGDALSLATSPTAEGDLLSPGDVLVVQNVGASPVTLTVASHHTVEGVALGAGGGSVPAGGVSVFKFGGAFAQPADDTYPGKVLVTYSTPADVHRAVVKA